MTQMLVESKRQANRGAIYLCDSQEEAWSGAIKPWFESVATSAWKSPRASLVVVPTRGHANAMRQRLLADRVSVLGVQFVTPAVLRELLSRSRGISHAPREHLRLLLAIAALEELRHAGDAQELAAKSVVRSPDHLLRAIERFDVAGWEVEAVIGAELQPIVLRFRELLRSCGFRLIGEHDRELLRHASRGEPQFEKVLVAGFDGAHWPHWQVLRATVSAAERATVVLEEPQDFSDLETCWIGSWEELLGETRRVSHATNRGDSLFSEAEMRGDSACSRRQTFIVGQDAAQQASAIAQCCASFLAQPACRNLAVVFPGRGALPRLVSTALAKLNIPHNDGLAHFAPGLFESAEWHAWIELQRSPRIGAFLRFINELQTARELFPNVTLAAIERAVRDAYADVLIDDLDVLRAACAESGRPAKADTARVLASIDFLPLRATLCEFIAQTQSALRRLGWKQQEIEIATRSGEWPAQIDVKISRTLFLRWLEEIAISIGMERSPIGGYPYARVQLLSLAQAQGREWSHLIVAESNQGLWPPPSSGEFARDEEIAAFNAKARQLNRAASGRGRFGEGHSAIRDGHSLYLGPAEQRAIADRQIESLLSSTTEEVAFAASLVQDSAPERLWNSSELLAKHYLKSFRKPLTQTAFAALQRATSEWLATVAEPPGPNADVEQARVAFDARRDVTKPAGEYEFALRPNESDRPTPVLSVSDFEAMAKTPALVWLKRYLGVEAWDESGNPWTAATGKWVHRWLAAIAANQGERLFARFPSAVEIDERIRISADEKRAEVQRLVDSLGKVVPDWWNSGWLNARYLARHLGSKIATAEGWQWLATEFAVGGDGPISIAPTISLLLRGQIDLILVQRDATDFEDQSIWIVDYKTGSADALKRSDLHDSLVKGTTLQLALYALALGATNVQMSILSPAVKNVAPQLDADALAPHESIFADLAAMQQTGVFGMKGEIRPGFGPGASYPLATLQIDVDVLEDKWALTHPALVLDKEEWEVW